MYRPIAIYKLCILTALIALTAASGAYAISFSGFQDAQLSGITVDKSYQVGVLDYTVTLGDNPTMTIGGKSYQVNWVQAFYVVSGAPGGSFTATNGSGNSWTWDTKTSGGGQISGWETTGNDRLMPGQSRTFHFGTFDPAGNPLVSGVHVSFGDSKNTTTGWYKWRQSVQVAMIPEPSSLLCFGVATIGFFGVAYRRRSRINSD